MVEAIKDLRMRTSFTSGSKVVVKSQVRKAKNVCGHPGRALTTSKSYHLIGKLSKLLYRICEVADETPLHLLSRHE